MIINATTIPRAVDLPQEPLTPDDARAAVLSHATACLNHPHGRDYCGQYARQLSIALWRDVDFQKFSDLVDDMAKLEEIRGGKDITPLYDTDEYETEDECRAAWIRYYEDAVALDLRLLMEDAGW